MRAVGSLLVLLVINAVLSSEFYVFAEGCDPNQCTNPNCMISNNTCSCVRGYSGMNCSIAACDIENTCSENEDCVMNPIFVKGYDCIPRACSALECTANETCGRLSNADNYTCLSNPCVSDSNCNSTNGVCTYHPQHNNYSCVCKPGYAYASRCNIELPCKDGDQEQQCRNGGTCMKRNGGINDPNTCNCTGGYTGLRCETDICHSLYPCVNGSCSVITSPPYYKCSCEKGYMGYNCSKLSGPCDFNGTCLNNGTCMADDNSAGGYKCLCTDDWDPATNCSTKINHCLSNPCGRGRCLSNSSHYTCDCYEGFYGRNCTFNNPCECQNGGTCLANTTCECPDEYIGPKCDIYDNCAKSNCNKTTERCVNHEKTFTCKCKSGYTGDDCSLDQCTCSERGTCMRNDTSHWCNCDSDYTGDDCQYRLCTPISCYNSGNCTNGDMEHFSCSCPEWATGTQCESLVDLVLPGFTVPNITDCPADCAQKRKNGDCDARCNVGVCDFDGGDCGKICDDVTSENISCQDVFKNGICNPECNSLECLQDGIDCRQNPPFCPERSCGDDFGNGKCNQTCNNAECQFDGGDCEDEKKERTILPGLLFIVIRATQEDFNRNTNRFLFEIAEALNCIPIFIRVDDVTGRLSKRQDSKNSSLEVDLKLDVTQCNSETETCVSSVENASNIIDNLSQNRGFRPSGYEILDTGTKPDPTPSTEPPTKLPVTLGSIFGITIGVVIISAIVLTTGIVIKRKRKAVIWRPEGPNNTPRSNSYEEDLPTAKRYVPGKERSSKDLHSETDDYPMKPMGEKEEWVDVPGEMDTNNCSATFVVGQVQRDPPSWSALHYKALRQPSMVHELVTKFNEETDTSVDVNIRGPGGYTSLMVAVMLGNVQRDGEDESDYECTRPSLINGSEAASPPRSLTVKDLLRMKADPNLKNDLGQTALHIAAACSRADVTRLLLSNRADPNAQDCNGRSPLHIAVTSEAEGVFQLLLRHKNTNPDLDAEDGTTPLILATQHHSVSMVEQLLKEAHVDANTQDKGGKTALHWAASMNMTDIMKILLKQGANKDSQDNNGQTPLFLAAKEGSSDAVRLLLESLANRNIQDNMERTPLRIAESRFHKDIVHLLTEAYYNHVSEQPSQHPDVRIQGPTCHGYSRPEVYEYLSEATTVPPPPYQTQYPGTSMHESHVTTTHNGYQSRQPDGAEDIQPSIKSSPHSIHSGVVVTPSGLPTACSLEPHMETSMYNTSNATTQYLRDTIGTMDLTTTTDALLQPMISPMSGYSPPYTGDPLQNSHDQASFGMTNIPTSPGGIIVNPTADINMMYYPSPPESNKSPCSYDSGAQIPTPPESYNSDGQIESPPSCMRLGPTVGFPACQGMYHGHQHPPLQQR